MTWRRLLVAEALKLVTLPPVWWASLGTLAVSVCFAALAAWTASTGGGFLGATDAPSFAGLLNQTGSVLALGAATVGVLAMSTEYDDGQIAATLLAAPRRGHLLAAKAVCAGLLIAGVVVGALAAVALGASHWLEVSAGRPVAALGATAWFIGLMGWALAVVARGGAAPLAVIATLVAIAPAVVAATTLPQAILPTSGPASGAGWALAAFAVAALVARRDGFNSR